MTRTEWNTYNFGGITMNNKPIIRISTRDCDMQAWFSEKTGAALSQLSILSWLLHHPENFPQFAEKPGLGLQYIDDLIWGAAEKSIRSICSVRVRMRSTVNISAPFVRTVQRAGRR